MYFSKMVVQRKRRTSISISIYTVNIENYRRDLGKILLHLMISCGSLLIETAALKSIQKKVSKLERKRERERQREKERKRRDEDIRARKTVKKRERIRANEES